MGDDSSIVQAARVSYGEGTKNVSSDRNLIRYLVRHKHTSPIEMVDFKFHCKMPIFVARQWVRHRTASINEYSARYSIIKDEFYVPEPPHIKAQDATNKQGRGEELYEQEVLNIKEWIHDHSYNSHNLYENFLKEDLARELARVVLPVNFYTEWYWKINLHNLLHFLKLRMDSHAQYEIRVYADAIYEIIKEIVPVTCEAFENYVLNAVTFSKQEFKLLIAFRSFHSWKDLLVTYESEENVIKRFKLSKRELQEFKEKLGIS
jgi:thymidylate synthase (FAD)